MDKLRKFCLKHFGHMTIVDAMIVIAILVILVLTLWSGASGGVR